MLLVLHGDTETEMVRLLIDQMCHLQIYRELLYLNLSDDTDRGDDMSLRASPVNNSIFP